ncbi:hypothetical protein Mp_2g17600 [Marchantia polymorpha subsp. ruderalis]|uniref:Uncharacterized protein n=1 Tax=Marchantia polymorpha TaxID=3197 RepID=A0A2R6WG83_MARPO|nr:hypothetical protein MARPO_0094s0028 [Marchantia polymorpha]BBN02727.1 hypothetical protein Mp_2g17600 [Marchantia polymorpha subsp. ruderalis]|eukprot:PTQ32851.1 hypothetical protein MARPO_0094s0028 [Marchantia polymorpha]
MRLDSEPDPSSEFARTLFASLIAAAHYYLRLPAAGTHPVQRCALSGVTVVQHIFVVPQSCSSKVSLHPPSLSLSLSLSH